MLVQNWTAYKVDPDGIETRLGQVVTSLTGTKERALSKANFKFLRGSLGYQLIVKKGTVEDK